MESSDRARRRITRPLADGVVARSATALLRRAGTRRESWRRSLRRRGARRARIQQMLAVDTALLAVAGAASAWGASLSGVEPEPVGWSVLYAVLALGAIALRGGYRFRLEVSPFEYVGQVVAGTAIAAMLVVAGRVLLEPSGDIAGQSVRIWVFATINLLAARMGTALGARRTSRRGRRTLVVGAGEIGRTVSRRLQERPELGLTPIGFLDKEPREVAVGRAMPVLGASWDLEEVVEREGVEHVIVAFSTAPHAVFLDLVRRCRALQLDVSVVPRLFEEVSRQVRVEHLGGIALLRVDQADPRGWQFEVKYAIDRVVSAVALMILALPLAAIALVVKLGSEGPILFRQSRVGLDGQEFEILKFRTMRVGPSGLENDAAWARRTLGDTDTDTDGEEAEPLEDRRTRIGTFLRRTSFDELPQLLNVVRGEMSLIGPRPERTGYVRAFEWHVYRYGDRHRVRSGLTGWAQVHGLRGETSLDDRVEWDNYYVENWSPQLDLKIVLLTVPALFAGSRER